MLPVTTLAERYLRHHAASGSSPHTLSWHRGTLQQFVAFLDATGGGLDVTTAREWVLSLRQRGLASATVATRVKSLRAFSAWLVADEYCERDPLRKLARPKSEAPPKRLLSVDDVDALLRACTSNRQGKRDKALILLLFSTGIRLAEACALTVADFDHSRGVVTVRRGKGGKPRTLPLSPRVSRAVEKYHDTLDLADHDPAFWTFDRRPMTRNSVQHALTRLATRAGLTFPVTPHGFRHSCATQYLRQGGNLETLRLLLGHATLTQVLTYARLAGVDVVDAHRTFDPTRLLRGR
jgi:site-specific recombinase XerD